MRCTRLVPDALSGARPGAMSVVGARAALVLAALAARGESRISGLEYLDRGYAELTGILAGLGARIARETLPPAGNTKKTPAKN